MDENKEKILYSYDRSSINDEEAKQRYSAYMQKMLALMEQQRKGGNTK